MPKTNNQGKQKVVFEIFPTTEILTKVRFLIQLKLESAEISSRTRFPELPGSFDRNVTSDRSRSEDVRGAERRQQHQRKPQPQSQSQFDVQLQNLPPPQNSPEIIKY